MRIKVKRRNERKQNRNKERSSEKEEQHRVPWTGECVAGRCSGVVTEASQPEIDSTAATITWGPTRGNHLNRLKINTVIGL